MSDTTTKVCAWCGEPATRQYVSDLFDRTDDACGWCYRWLTIGDRAEGIVSRWPQWIRRMLPWVALAALVGVFVAGIASWIGWWLS